MATIDEGIDWISRRSGYGNISSSAADILYGIKRRSVGVSVPYNTDSYGLTFFTKPNLNLSYDNLTTDRVFSPLITKGTTTYQRAVRVMLDPMSAIEGGDKAITSPLVDERSPFLAILTNLLISLNGWPDPVVNVYTSKEGTYKEQWSMIDDVARNLSTFDLTASFRNIAGDPITLLFNTWIRYAARVYDGTMTPYPVCIVENEIDYQTRIYRLVLDRSKRYVQKIAACGAAFPTSSFLGSAMNFATDAPFNHDNSQIQIPFHCIGVDYQDPILIREFNDIVMLFNPNMRDENRVNSLKQLSPNELDMFDTYGYPRIDPKTFELQWFVTQVDYNAVIQSLG